MLSRYWLRGLGLGVALLTSGGAQAASSSAIAGGSTFWFYSCSGEQAMFIGVLGADHKVRNVATLEPGDTIRIWIDKGQLVSWRCGVPVTKSDYFIYATTQ